MPSLLLITTIIAFAIRALQAKRLIVSALWLAGVSALLAVVLYINGAHQAAVIELSVGAGLVTVVFVFAISIAGEDAIGGVPLLSRPLSLSLTILSVLLLGWFVVQTSLSPHFEDPVNTEPGFATILWQHRGFDVLVQIVVIFSGALGLLGLLAEVKAPLEGAAAGEVAARRDRELDAMEQQILTQEEDV